MLLYISVSILFYIASTGVLSVAEYFVFVLIVTNLPPARYYLESNWIIANRLRISLLARSDSVFGRKVASLTSSDSTGQSLSFKVLDRTPPRERGAAPSQIPKRQKGLVSLSAFR